MARLSPDFAHRLVVTDCGGIYEEPTYLVFSRLTMRANTERPVAVTMGTNTLVGRDMGLPRREVAAIQRGTDPGCHDALLSRASARRGYSRKT